MAINETIVTGRKFRKLIDISSKAWQRISFWTHSSDVEFNDKKDAETKLGAIDGITDSLASTSSRIAASAKSVCTLNANLTNINNNINRINMYVGSDGKLHFVNSAGADTVIPFSSVKDLQVRAKAHVKDNVQYFYVRIYNEDNLIFDQGGWLTSGSASSSKDSAGYVTINNFTA